MKPKAGLPFSRPFRVDKIPDDGIDVDVEATPAECAAIATEGDLPSVAMLVARYRLDRLSGRRYSVKGELKARFTQVCVVTLDPFETEVVRPIELLFVESASLTAAGTGKSRRRDADAGRVHAPQSIDGEADPPDPVVDGMIDLGDVAFEFLMLARDFYPRKPGVEFSDVVVGDADDREPSAFMALQRLKDGP